MTVSALLGDVVHWFTTERGCDTLDFFGGLLLGVEYFTIILGEERVERISWRIAGWREKFDPQSTYRIAKWITFGPVAAIAVLLAMSLLVWVAMQEASDPKTMALLENNGSIDPGRVFQIFFVIVLRPLLCLGLAAGVYLSRSTESQEHIKVCYKKVKKKYTFRKYQLVDFGYAMEAILATLFAETFFGVFRAGVFYKGRFSRG